MNSKKTRLNNVCGVLNFFKSKANIRSNQIRSIKERHDWKWNYELFNAKRKEKTRCKVLFSVTHTSSSLDQSKKSHDKFDRMRQWHQIECNAMVWLECPRKKCVFGLNWSTNNDNEHNHNNKIWQSSSLKNGASFLPV